MKYPVILQHSEEDCGAACLASVAKYYGRFFTLSRLRELSGTGQQGTTLLGLKQGAEAIGFDARPMRANPEILEQLHRAPLPMIVHWRGYHWVVLYGQKGKKYAIADPGVGLLYVSETELREGWRDWICLLLEPDPERFSEQTSDPPPGVWRWFRRTWAYRRLLVQVLLLNAVLGLLAIASPFFIQILTDEVLVRGDTQMLTGVAIAVILMNFFAGAVELVQSNLIAHFGQRLELGLVMEFGRKLLGLPLTYYETHRSGEVISRLRDIREINQLLAQFIVSLPSQFFVALVSLAVMLIYNVPLTLAAIAIAVLMTVTTAILLPILQRKTRDRFALDAENQGLLVETFRGAIAFKTTNGKPQLWEELQTRFGRLANLTFRSTQIGIVNTVFSNAIGNVGIVALLWLGSRFVIADLLTIGQLLAFINLNRNVSTWVNSLVGFADDLTRVQTATQRLSDVVDATPETPDNLQLQWAEISPGDHIICDRVSFRYGGRIDLLDNFSVLFPGGKAIALIGRSGCGKSTLAKLIAGLYPLGSGNIRYGVYNQQDLSPDCLRQQVVLVPQDAHFWSRSILDNFRLGNPGLSFEKVVEACQVVGADEFISQLPEKYQTVLGEFGANISGGQRQRLAIARAIVTDPSVLILDESTASLDPISEAELLTRLLQLRRGKTTILISHRPRVIERADWMILLDEGHLKLQGALSELRSLPGEHLDFLGR